MLVSVSIFSVTGTFNKKGLCKGMTHVTFNVDLIATGYL